MGRLEKPRPRYKLIWRTDRKRFVCRWWDASEEEWQQKTLEATQRRYAEEEAKDFLDGKQLESKRGEPPSPLTWYGFRVKYEAERGPALDNVAVWKSVANKLQSLVAPDALADITPALLSEFASKMRSAGLAPATIETYLKYIRAALNWAEAIELITKAPRVRIPSRKGHKHARGRAVVGEEFDRWLKKLKTEVGASRYPSWERLARGLYLSGLRRGEALNLWWDRDDMLMPLNIDGKHPVLQIPSKKQKSREHLVCPLTPDFVEFLRKTAKRQRTGPVFSPLSKTGVTRSPDYVGRVLSAAGKAARIVVARDGDEIRYATAHDLRRSFGDRWAQRVMPAILKELMRHKSIETTMRYYVGRAAEQTAEVLWSSVTSAGDQKGDQRPSRRKSSDKNA